MLLIGRDRAEALADAAGDTPLFVYDSTMLSARVAELTEEVKAAAEAVRTGQIDGSFHIFTGPIKDNTGTERVPAGQTMTDAELLSMDWYVEGVEQQA